jgi:hypothetical protein
MCNGNNHSPDCDCGWGGGSHSSSNHVLERPPTLGSLNWKNRSEDFTRRTICPECRKEIFFVRHNGGSVWFDSLGMPWPKHPCKYENEANSYFYDGNLVHNSDERNLHNKIEVNKNRVKNAILVVLVGFERCYSFINLIFKCSNNQEIYVGISKTFSCEYYLGKLFFLSTEEMKIVSIESQMVLKIFQMKDPRKQYHSRMSNLYYPDGKYIHPIYGIGTLVDHSFVKEKLFIVLEFDDGKRKSFLDGAIGLFYIKEI